jgi:hypothetical protein
MSQSQHHKHVPLANGFGPALHERRVDCEGPPTRCGTAYSRERVRLAPALSESRTCMLVSNREHSSVLWARAPLRRLDWHVQENGFNTLYFMFEKKHGVGLQQSLFHIQILFVQWTPKVAGRIVARFTLFLGRALLDVCGIELVLSDRIQHLVSDLFNQRNVGA